MIDRAHPLPVSRQVKLVGISRSSAYYVPSPVSGADLALMRRIDELHLEHPFAGARMLMRLLKREGIVVGRKHVGTLMCKMGIEALYRLLRDRKIERSNQVFALDTTYVPMAQGFVYLTAVIDWASRRVLAHRVAITMEAEHAVAALEEAFAKYGLPEIVNTDQGSQFTSTDFTDAVRSRGIALSMDGKGSWRDNVFIERLWRSVKYEEIYLKAYESVGQARQSIANYLTWYNQQRPHSSLSDKTPDEAYFAMLPAMKTAA
jgi:putative transposase